MADQISAKTKAYLDQMKSAPRRSRWKQYTAGTLAVLVLCAGAYGAYAWYHSGRQELASRQLAEKLSQAEGRQGFEMVRAAVDAGQIAPEQARQVMWQAREAREEQVMKDYFALTSETARNNYLDKLIREEEARFQQRERQAATRPTTRPTTRPNRGDGNDPAGNNGGGNGNRGGGDSARTARRDAQPPQARAMRAEFRAAMASRRAVLGIPDRPRGGGRGRG